MTFIKRVLSWFRPNRKSSDSTNSQPEIDSSDSSKKEVYEIVGKDWKFCAIINLEMHENYEESFQFENALIRIFRPSDEWFKQGFIAEVYAKKEDFEDITSAYFALEELLERFLHRLALVTFKRVNIIQEMGATCFKVEVGQEFDLLLPNVLDLISEKYEDITLAKYVDSSKDIESVEIMDALREIKLSLATDLILQKYHHYYNAIERLATLETTDYVTRKCDNCGVEEKIGIKATGNKMRELFKAEGYSNKEFKKCRSLRGKIAHGSGGHGSKIIEDVNNYLGTVEKVAANTLSRVSGLKILRGIIPRVHRQFTNITGKKEVTKTSGAKAQYNIVNISFSSTVSFNKVNDVLEHDKEFKPLMTPVPVDINPENFKIFPYSWPY